MCLDFIFTKVGFSLMGIKNRTLLFSKIIFLHNTNSIFSIFAAQKNRIMKFKKGDKVRFLNEKGGGTIVKELNSFMVSVEIEDGFEIPTLSSELVLITSEGTSGNMFLKQGEETSAILPEQAKVIDEITEDRITPIYKPTSSSKVPSGVYLSWIPTDQNRLLTSPIHIYIINNTPHDILYNFTLKNADNNFSGIDFGSVPPESKLLLEHISRDDISMWSSGTIQILFFREEGDKILMPVSSTFRIKGSVLYADGSYHISELHGNKKAIIYTVCELNRIPSTYEAILSEKENRESLPTAAEKFRTESAIDKHRIGSREAEVDLHISALRDFYNSLSPHEILTIQLGYFDRMLESALAFNYHKVIFIHGIGNGVLKQSIIERLNQYTDIELKPASFAKYGNGAIELILHQND